MSCRVTRASTVPDGSSIGSTTLSISSAASSGTEAAGATPTGSVLKTNASTRV